jgi:pimeloyl-ACP methyl ester carboxylesterase
MVSTSWLVGHGFDACGWNQQLPEIELILESNMTTDNIIMVGDGRKLEVREYGDRGGHPAFFFHGLIGSHHQASYVSEQAKRARLRIIAPNRPGVGRSEFVVRKTPLDVVSDVEDVAKELRLGEFSVIGISGGAPYTLAVLNRLGERIRTATIISGMGPTQLPGALHGMDQRRRLILAAGSRYPKLARQAFQVAAKRYRANPERFLQRLLKSWTLPDQRLFQRREVFDLFLEDLREVFIDGKGPEGLAQELTMYRNYGFPLEALPTDRRVTLWHGLTDNIVPPSMTWKMAQELPNAEAHFVPGGHFMAIDAATLIVGRLRQQLES